MRMSPDDPLRASDGSEPARTPRTKTASAGRPTPESAYQGRYGRDHIRSRKLGLYSAPAALLALCVALAGMFAWALGQGAARAQGFSAAPLPISVEAALMAFPILTPLILIAIRKLHWRRMRQWLRRAVYAVLFVWAIATALIASALL
jgi:hypothetical protein